jgi:hypothetical protein
LFLASTVPVPKLNIPLIDPPKLFPLAIICSAEVPVTTIAELLGVSVLDIVLLLIYKLLEVLSALTTTSPFVIVFDEIVPDVALVEIAHDPSPVIVSIVLFEIKILLLEETDMP